MKAVMLYLYSYVIYRDVHEQEAAHVLLSIHVSLFSMIYRRERRNKQQEVIIVQQGRYPLLQQHQKQRAQNGKQQNPR